MYAERVETTPAVMYNGLPVPTVLRTLTSQQAAEPWTRISLNQLASSIKFAFLDLGNQLEGTQGVTSPNLEEYPEGIQVLQGDKSDQVGLASGIIINKAYLDGLVELHKSSEKNKY